MKTNNDEINAFLESVGKPEDDSKFGCILYYGKILKMYYSEFCNRAINPKSGIDIADYNTGLYFLESLKFGKTFEDAKIEHENASKNMFGR